MTLLTPLGLLGLLGIAILILIYVIRPNYQQKVISSTYVWKLSLKYRKKKIPTSKLKNILLIVCQILIIAACATILAQPNKVLKTDIKEREVIAIIDSSASMRTETDSQTRYERAVNSVTQLTDSVYDENGLVSIIIADSSPTYLAQRTTAEAREQISSAMSDLLVEGTKCSYASSNINAALSLCEEILAENPLAEIYVYTDSTYYLSNNSSIKVVNVCDESEWNVGILGASADLEDNYYVFTVYVACYGRDESVDISLDIAHPNAQDKNDDDADADISISETVNLSDDLTTKVIFKYFAEADVPESTDNTIYVPIGDDTAERIYSYQSIHVHVSSASGEDSFAADDNYDIFGGQKEVIKVEYYSSEPNTYFSSQIRALSNYYKDELDIQLTEIKVGEDPILTGFDFYIFEHTIPATLPTDGVVLISDPDNRSTAGISIGGKQILHKEESLYEEVQAHPLLNYMKGDRIEITSYTSITAQDPAYEVLLSYQGHPIFLARNDGMKKIAVLAFDMTYSNFSQIIDFTLFMRNMFEYYMPAMVKGNSFDVYESVSLYSRGGEIEVSGYELNKTFDTFPATLQLLLPGTYTITQTTDFGKTLEESIYVKIPQSESNIFAEGENLIEPYREKLISDYYKDLLVYIAAALVALTFLEWILQLGESM